MHGLAECTGTKSCDCHDVCYAHIFLRRKSNKRLPMLPRKRPPLKRSVCVYACVRVVCGVDVLACGSGGESGNRIYII